MLPVTVSSGSQHGMPEHLARLVSTGRLVCLRRDSGFYGLLLWVYARVCVSCVHREGRVSDALQWVQSALYPLVVSHPILEQPTKDTLALLAYSEPEVGASCMALHVKSTSAPTRAPSLR